MNCLSIGHGDFREIKEILSSAKFAELRLDLLTDFEPLEELLSCPARIIVTCRAGRFTEEKRAELLRRALKAGVWGVDLDFSDTALIEDVRKTSTTLILSYHDFEGTPSSDRLRALIAESKQLGADVTKLACMVREKTDIARLLGLLTPSERLVVFGMGELGSISRIISPLVGSEWTYLSVRPGLETAPGQISVDVAERMQKILAGE